MAERSRQVVLFSSGGKKAARPARRELFDYEAEEARTRRAAPSRGRAASDSTSYTSSQSSYRASSYTPARPGPGAVGGGAARYREEEGPYGSRRKGSGAARPHAAARRRKARRRRRRFRRLVAFLCVLAGLYVLCVYSSIPFIRKWRTIYIETAMETMNHKWLATAFIPKGIIDEVMASRDAFLQAQAGLESDWSEGEFIQDFAPGSQEEFLRLYHEIDPESFRDYVKKNPLVTAGGYDALLIDRSGLDQDGTSIKTVQGDTILTIDAKNRLLIVRVEGEDFVGRLAIVKDPSLVKVGTAATLGKAGQSVAQIAERSKAVLAVNASGFADYQGMGNGGTVVGLLISGGELLSPCVGGDYKVIGFSEDHRLYIGKSLEEVAFRDAVEFYPALIVNGQNVVSDSDAPEGSVGFGIQPRTAIGQTEDGAVLLLTVDGRKPGYSLGCTMTDLASTMERYGAVQAANLDGGSSTVMVYRGKEISRPAAGTSYGRVVPNAIVVTYADKAK